MVYTKDEVLKTLDDEGVRYIRLWFTDILGRLKGMSISRSEIETVMEEGQGFDGSSIEGYVRIEESDLMAMPDLRTFRIFPWTVGSERVAMFFCDVQTPDGKPYEGDPRWVLQQQLKVIEDQGYTYYVGPEIEYFYFRDKNGTEVLDTGGYFDYGTIDEGTRARKQAVNALEEIGIQVECSHHEVAPSQHEIDLRYQSALKMADFAMIYRLAVKELAAKSGLYATFMPKPLFGENGSGMHTHMSLFKDEKNAFFDANGPYHLSDMARKYIAGILKHIPEITLVLNQWVNSYKRLVVGYEAPCYLSWGRRNRSSLIRVPMYKVGKEKATRIEVRSPDPACNPYLAFALMLAAGMEGVKNNYDLPEPIEENIFEMETPELKRRNIASLPKTLEEAIDIFERSELAKRTLGDHVFNRLIANKRVEWDLYRTQVTDYEIKNYLPEL